MAPLRMLLVHAHPDDEASSTGATIARYAAAGAGVVLVTCTRGEHGEIVAADLAGLRDVDPDGLGRHREGELAEAVALLGGTRHHWLGGTGRWRDSGMAGTPENADPRAFAGADPALTTRELVALLRAERPHVVITYDANGGYGHPDHIQAHRVTLAALDPAADPGYLPELGDPWRVPKTYATVLAASTMRGAVDAGLVASLDDLPAGAADEEIAARVDGREHLAAKVAALRAHRSQVDMAGFFGKLVRIPGFALEHYALLRGDRGPGDGPHGWETDLFAGIDTVSMDGEAGDDAA